MDQGQSHFYNDNFFYIFISAAPTPPPGQCSLDVTNVGEITEDDRRGYYFGGYPNSRIEFDKLSKSLRIRYMFSNLPMNKRLL